MKLSKTLWCVSFIVTAVFSMPVFAETPVGQLDSLDNIAGTGWTDQWLSGYMQQALVGGVNEVNEGAGSMKIDFTLYPGSSPYSGKELCKPQKTFNPVLDVNYQDHAITLQVWSGDVNDSRSQTASSRLVEILLYDSIGNHTGQFVVPPLRYVGWNKVIAPFKNFKWMAGSIMMDPCDAVWNNITKIRLITSCGTLDPYNAEAIYMDDLRLEVAPNDPNRPYQIASCDNLVDDLWDELRGSGIMLPNDVNVHEGTGSMEVAFEDYAPDVVPPYGWDITPSLYFVPALDFTDDYNEWAITLWLWTDLVDKSKLHEIILHDNAWHLGRFRVPIEGLNEGWNKVTARLDEILWNVAGSPRLDMITISPDEVSLDAIVLMELWTTVSWDSGNAIYLDDFQFEEAVEALTEAKVYNADYGTITVDGNPADWAGLVDSDILDFDLQAVSDPNGNLHVKYRLAWDETYLYILVEEQPGDGIASEAADHAAFSDPTIGMSEYYDSLALDFDFQNCRYPGIASHINFFLFLGLDSDGRTDLMFSLINGLWGDQQDSQDIAEAEASVEHGSVATSGTFGGGDRVIEARVMWTDLDDHVYPWLLPEGGLAAKVKPGYIFGVDPRLCDTEIWKPGEGQLWTTEKGIRWLNGGQPSGRDPNSIDVRLVCSAGDLDFDCDVDFVDYAQLAAEWSIDDCNNLNKFCNGADIVINGEVNMEDLAKFTQRWLD